MMQYSSNDVEIVSRESLYDGFLSLDKCVLRHRLFAGGWSKTLTRELLRRADAVAVLLYDPERDAVVLVEQFRVGALQDEKSPWLLELVAGVFEEGESPEQVANREALEETGCALQNLGFLNRFYTSPGGCTEQVYLFVARVDASKAAALSGVGSESEDIRVHVYPADRAFDLLNKGQINNAITLVGLQWLQLHKTQLQQQWLQGETQ